MEFVELGLGDASEQREAAGLHNVSGLHGNAIVTRAPLGDPWVVRLPETGGLGWFAADSPQPRVGGRMAVVATVTIDGVAVEVASTHLENRSDPAHRAEQMEVLLQVIDERAEGGPAVVGGDLNTLGASYAELFDHHLVRALRRVDPARFSWPVPTNRSSMWHGHTVSGGPTRTWPRPPPSTTRCGRPDHVPIRLDWLLVRGLVARRAVVVPAGGLSDHHLVSVGVRLP